MSRSMQSTAYKHEKFKAQYNSFDLKQSDCVAQFARAPNSNRKVASSMLTLGILL